MYLQSYSILGITGCGGAVSHDCSATRETGKMRVACPLSEGAVLMYGALVWDG